MVLGGLVLALVFAQLTDAIVGARLAQALGQGPLPKRDHVVVCGVGRTGGRILEDLVAAGVPCIAVEREESAVDAGRLRRLGVPLVVGDAASGETLDDLRLGSARALMAMTSDDLANLQCALLARARAPDLRVVLRLFDHDLAVRVPAGGARPASRSVSALAAPPSPPPSSGAESPRSSRWEPGSCRSSGSRPGCPPTCERSSAAARLACSRSPGVAFPDVEASVAAGDELMVVGTGLGLAELERRVAG